MRSKGKHQDKMTQTLHIFTFTLEIESLITTIFFFKIFLIMIFFTSHMQITLLLKVV